MSKKAKSTTAKQNGLQATSLRSALAFLMVLVLGAGVAGVYFGLQMVRDYSTEVGQVSADAIASNDLVTDLQALQGAVSQSAALIDKANRMFTTPQDYQGQALQDVRAYAAGAGISINSTSFEAPTEEEASSTETPATDSGMEGTPSPETQPATPATPQNIIVVTLDSPVSYAQLLQFIHAIEGNLPKMQIKELNIQRPGTPNGDAVEVEAIIIEVLTR